MSWSLSPFDPCFDIYQKDCVKFLFYHFEGQLKYLKNASAKILLQSVPRFKTRIVYYWSCVPFGKYKEKLATYLTE